MNPSILRSSHQVRTLWLLVIAVALLPLSTRLAHAASTSNPCTASPSTWTISSSNVSASAGTPNGTVLGVSQVSVDFDCTNVFAKSGNDGTELEVDMLLSTAHLDTTTTAPNGGVMFATTVAGSGTPSGIDVELTATVGGQTVTYNRSNGAQWALGYLYKSNCSGNGNSFTCPHLDVTFTARLIKVGTVTAGAFSAFVAGQYEDHIYQHADISPAFGSINIGSITSTTAACTIAVDPTVVTLPTVMSASFSGTGYTTGQQPFDINLDCSTAGKNLSITISTAAQELGTSSVIAPTAGSGYAGNVGVQILDGSGSPISFGVPISEGTTSSGSMSLPFSARYYQTGSPVTAGRVTATATYTLTYQ